MEKPTLLILDDKETITKVLAAYFAADYRCISFDNPLDGIQWLEAGNMPDLIISDLRMPKMRGDEFLKYIKANQLFSHIPVVILSAEDSSSERIRLLEEGAEDYIVKPFNPTELKTRIKKILS